MQAERAHVVGGATSQLLTAIPFVPARRESLLTKPPGEVSAVVPEGLSPLLSYGFQRFDKLRTHVGKDEGILKLIHDANRPAIDNNGDGERGYQDYCAENEGDCNHYYRYYPLVGEYRKELKTTLKQNGASSYRPDSKQSGVQPMVAVLVAHWDVNGDEMVCGGEALTDNRCRGRSTAHAAERQVANLAIAVRKHLQVGHRSFPF
jgi:hypothetical protein